MNKSDQINEILGIQESYQLPDKLMKILKDKSQRGTIFRNFKDTFGDIPADFFTDYFQESHSNRDKFMQDFTPLEVSEIIAKQIEGSEVVADICAGIGGLSIPIIKRYPNVELYCEELSARAIPLLLFNLSYYNASAIVVHGNSLSQETQAVYKLTPTGEYSNIEEIEQIPEVQADVVVMNPPYSLKHEWDYKNPDDRFKEYSQPPKQYSDLGFIIHGISKMKENGKLWAILPHGILFRGSKEEAIRKQFVEKNMIKTIIGLPPNLFLNTSIPVCLVELEQGSENVLFVDAKKEFTKKGSISKLEEKHIKKIEAVIDLRSNVERFASLVEKKEIEDNSYNLNIPRYVDIYVPKPLPSMREIYQEYIETEKEIKQIKKDFYHMLKSLVSTNGKDEELDHLKEMVKLSVGGDDD